MRRYAEHGTTQSMQAFYMLMHKAEHELLWDAFDIWSRHATGELLHMMHLRMGYNDGASTKSVKGAEDIMNMSGAELDEFYVSMMKEAGYDIDLSSIVSGETQSHETDKGL